MLVYQKIRKRAASWCLRTHSSPLGLFVAPHATLFLALSLPSQDCPCLRSQPRRESTQHRLTTDTQIRPLPLWIFSDLQEEQPFALGAPGCKHRLPARRLPQRSGHLCGTCLFWGWKLLQGGIRSPSHGDLCWLAWCQAHYRCSKKYMSVEWMNEWMNECVGEQVMDEQLMSTSSGG